MIKVLIRYWLASLNQKAFKYQISKLESYAYGPNNLKLDNSNVSIVDEDKVTGAKMALVKLGVREE